MNKQDLINKLATLEQEHATELSLWKNKVEKEVSKVTKEANLELGNLAKKNAELVKKNADFRDKLARAGDQAKTLQAELAKTRTLLERIREMIAWFEQNILNADGTFPKFKWYNIGKLITLATYLAQTIPGLIKIFKGK